MLKITIHKLNGDVLFAGFVPERAVSFRGGIASPRVATISLPIEDMLSQLAQRPPADATPFTAPRLQEIGRSTS